MKRFSRNLSIILRAERLIARRQLAVMRRQIGLLAFAGLVAALGVVMLNVAAYLGLNKSIEPWAAALIVGAVNLGCAGALALWAGRMSAKSDVAPVTELRDMALEDLEQEIDATKDELVQIIADLRALRRDPLGAATSHLLLPLITSLLGQLRK